MLDSGNHSYWNALGVVALSKGMSNTTFFTPWSWHWDLSHLKQVTTCLWLKVSLIPLSGLENFALAQHCFIKSIQVESSVSINTHTHTLHLLRLVVAM